jgi:hypothetical protein
MTQVITENIIQFPVQANLNYGMSGLQLIPQQAWNYAYEWSIPVTAGVTVILVPPSPTHAFRTLRMFFTADKGGPWLITWEGACLWRIRTTPPFTSVFDFMPYGIATGINGAVNIKNENSSVSTNLDLMIVGFYDETQT